MASLTAAAPNAASGDRDRAQLLLVGAFTLAVLVVVLALALNGAAHTENLATERTDVQDGRDAVRFQHSVRRGVGGGVEAVNHRNDTSYNDLRSALEAAVSEWEALATRGSAGESVGISVGLTDDWEKGSRIAQTTVRNFTDAKETANWTLASSVGRTRAFEMNVSRAKLSSSCTSGCFGIVADNGSATWRASVTNNSSAIEVTVDGPTGTDTCRVTADSVVVDFSAGTMADGACSFPGFADGLSGPYNVTYENGSSGNGTYELVVDTDVVDDSRYANDANPSVSPAIYSTNVSLTYQTPRLTYTTVLRVAPGERDA